MAEESSIKKSLQEKFGSLSDDKFKIQRKRRITVETGREDFEDVLKFSINELEFVILCAITGLDEIERFSVIYHIAKIDGVILNIKVAVPKTDAVIRTVTPYFSAADIYEREIADLLGIRIDGLPSGNRYPLPDDWPADEYPLRKDWKKNGT
jgi:NADH:ubiquinone oxidoreductase subunit C